MHVLFVIAKNQYRDEELSIPQGMMDEAGITYDIAAKEPGECTGQIGTPAMATISIDEADPEAYDAIILIGGSGAQEYLWDNLVLHEHVRAFNDAGKVVAAICLSPAVLAQAKILMGKNVTYFSTPLSDKTMKLAGANVVNVPVVADGNIITANGPDASEAFGEMIIERLS